MVDINISLIGGNGDVISLGADSDFILTGGLIGFGIPATQVRLDDSASDGGVWRSTKRGIRQVDLPVAIVGTSRADVELKLRRLTRLLVDRTSPTIIRAAYDSGEEWELIAHYTGGAESQYGDSGNENWIQWVLSFQAPDPSWVRATTESYLLTSGVTGRGLIPHLAELQLSSSQAIGTLDIDNPGDVSAYPVWSIQGPIDSIVITSDEGQSFSYEAAILSGDTVTINTKDGTVIDDAGDNMYANLGSSPKLFRIPAGNSSLSVSATGATGATAIAMYYQPRKEIVH